MCLAIPGKVVETYREHDVLMGKVDFGGVSKRVCLEHVPEVRIDDYVLVHVGFALSRIDEAEARARVRVSRADGPARRTEGAIAMKYLDEYRDGAAARKAGGGHRADRRPGRGRSWKSAAARRTPSSSTGSTRSCRRASSWCTGRAARSASRRWR